MFSVNKVAETANTRSCRFRIYNNPANAQHEERLHVKWEARKVASRSGGGESSTPPPVNFRTPPSRGDDFALNASEQNLAVEASASIRSDDPCAVNVSVSIISIASATTIVSQRRKSYAYVSPVKQNDSNPC